MTSIKDIVILSDNNKYIVMSKIELNRINYYYIVDINNMFNNKICYEEIDNDKVFLNELEDGEIKEQLKVIFSKQLIERYNSLNGNN